jgi:hypothetical protein
LRGYEFFNAIPPSTCPEVRIHVPEVEPMALERN